MGNTPVSAIIPMFGVEKGSFKHLLTALKNALLGFVKSDLLNTIHTSQLKVYLVTNIESINFRPTLILLVLIFS